MADRRRPIAVSEGVHALVEHTCINPNKAAHIGHLRNAILGDTFVRLLRAAGYKVDVQNYIDNTGVQVADVVVGFLHLEEEIAAEVRALSTECVRAATVRPPAASTTTAGTLYARTSQWYANWEPTRRIQPRARSCASTRCTLIEQGGNETAEIADLISTAVLRRHLETMLRLGIEYDFLPRESEILHLKFWDAAFEQLKKSGVLYFENEGKNKGCWVMTRPGVDGAGPKPRRPEGPTKTPRSSSAPTAPSPTSAKTLPTTFGSSACSAATSATSGSSTIPITSAGSPPNPARRTIRTSAAPRPSTTSSMRASPTRRPT